MTGDGGLVEVQATAERTPLSRAHLDELLALAEGGIERLRGIQERGDRRGLGRRSGAVTRGSPARLLLATHNEHKRREFERLLGAARAGDGELDALARRGAAAAGGRRDVRRERARQGRGGCAATGGSSIADDSGIAAAALGGAPGVRSARYAGEHASDGENLAKLLREAPAGSALEYVCAIAYVDPRRGVERLFEGRCAGAWPREPRGERGFGYDPAFLPDDAPPGSSEPADDGRAHRRAEGRDQPSRAGRRALLRGSAAAVPLPTLASAAQSRLMAAEAATATPRPA